MFNNSIKIKKDNFVYYRDYLKIYFYITINNVVCKVARGKVISRQLLFLEKTLNNNTIIDIQAQILETSIDKYLNILLQYKLKNKKRRIKKEYMYQIYEN